MLFGKSARSLQSQETVICLLPKPGPTVTNLTCHMASANDCSLPWTSQLELQLQLGLPILLKAQSIYRMHK